MVVIFAIPIQCTLFCVVVHKSMELLFIILNHTPHIFRLWSPVNEAESKCDGVCIKV